MQIVLSSPIPVSTFFCVKGSNFPSGVLKNSINTLFQISTHLAGSLPGFEFSQEAGFPLSTKISVSEPQKEGKTGLFSKSYISYRVQCPQLESDVRRTYADFEWLRNAFLIRYPLRIIPPIYKENVIKQIGNVLKLENEQVTEEKKIRYLNQFMDCITKKKNIKNISYII
jgi:hypothetical protein